MSFADSVVELFVKHVGPWLLKHVWPVLRDEIVKLIGKVVTRIFKWVHSLVDGSRTSTVSKFAENAREAEKQAKESTTDAEFQRYKAIAEVWRQAADVLVRENEALKQKLAEIQAVEESAIEPEVGRLLPELSGETLVIGEQKVPLERLE